MSTIGNRLVGGFTDKLFWSVDVVGNLFEGIRGWWLGFRCSRAIGRPYFREFLQWAVNIVGDRIARYAHYALERGGCPSKFARLATFLGALEQIELRSVGLVRAKTDERWNSQEIWSLVYQELRPS